MATDRVRDAIATDPSNVTPDPAPVIADGRVDTAGGPIAELRPASPIQVMVRKIRLPDLPDLRNAGTTIRFNQPESLLSTYQPLRAGMLAALPGRRNRKPMFVAHAEERLVGFVQFQPCEPDGRWVLLAAGESVGVYDEGPVFEALLDYGVRQAGLRGVKRLFARVPDGAIVTPALWRQAWAPYASETIYLGRKNAPLARPRVTPRRQTRADTWAIHQLYTAAVPRPVQHAEALTSHHWDLQLAKPPNATRESSGLLIEDGHNVVGYARISASGRASLLEFVYHPARLDILSDLVDSALQVARRQPGGHEYCAVRGYQAELATALEGRGLVPMIEQNLLIKYTTATVRLPVIETVPFQLEVPDKMPQRVPTFLQGHPTDQPTA